MLFWYSSRWNFWNQKNLVPAIRDIHICEEKGICKIHSKCMLKTQLTPLMSFWCRNRYYVWIPYIILSQVNIQVIFQAIFAFYTQWKYQKTRDFIRKLEICLKWFKRAIILIYTDLYDRTQLPVLFLIQGKYTKKLVSNEKKSKGQSLKYKWNVNDHSKD